jgi:hypothetical protein
MSSVAKIARGLATGAGLTVAGLCCLCFPGCEKQPTEPDSPHAPRDYAVYCADLYAPVAYAYKVVSGQLDTINLPFVAEYGLAVSPHGDTIYAAGGDGVASVDVSTENFTLVWTGFATYGIALSPNGRYLAIHGDDLTIMDLATMTSKLTDTDATFRGVFAVDSRRFYAPTVAGAQIYEASLVGGGEVSRTSFQGRGYRSILVSPDESKWFLYDAEECAGRFEVLDRDADSILFSHRVVPGNGQMAVSPNGRWAFYTSPGMIEDFCDDSPSYSVGAYGILRNEVATDIGTKVSVGGLSDSAVIVDVIITPDSQWLVGLSWRGEFITVDLARMRVVRFLRIEIPRRPTQYLSCQSLT